MEDVVLGLWLKGEGRRGYLSCADTKFADQRVPLLPYVSGVYL